YAVGGNAGSFSFWMLVVAALFTSFYSWRLIHLAFHGTPRPATHGEHAHDDHGSAYDHAHEAPNVMMVPLYVLAAGAVLAGAVFYGMFFHDTAQVEQFFAGSLVVDHDIIEAAHHVPLWVKWSATVA